MAPFQGLAHLADLLGDVVARQRSSFGADGSKASLVNGMVDDADAPPDLKVPVSEQHERDAKARFAPSDSWRRPTDYVAYMAKRFEE